MIAGGTVRVPGDKSVSHRVLMLAALADGPSELRGVLAAGDTRATASCLRALGVRVGSLRAGAPLRVAGHGLGAFRAA